MPQLIRDFRHGLRVLGRTPAFTTVAVLILALGIGANTAVFSVVNAMVLQPRPGRVDTLVSVFNRDRTRPDSYRNFSYPLYVDLRERGDVFEGLLAHTFGLVGVGDGESTRRSFVEIVSANYFSTLGVRLAAGRAFTLDEERPAANAPVVIASYATWRHHAFDPSLVGSTVRVNGADFTIVGIAPQGFAGTMTVVAPEWWFPLGTYDLVVSDMLRQRDTGLADRANHAFNIAGALRSGMTRGAAETALNGFAVRLAEEFPATDRDRALLVAGVPRFGVSSRPTDESGVVAVAGLLTLMSALILLVACLNLANLLLARGAARRREVAIRQALGSGRRRIVQQLLVEAFTLSLAGAAAGLVCAWWAASALGAWLAGVLPLGIQLVVEPSPRMLAAAVGFAMLSTILFALGPAWRLSRPALVDDLKGQQQRLAGRFRTGVVLVGTQLALSLALVAVGGLFVRGALNAAGATVGFAVERQLVVALDPALAGYAETRTRATYRDILQRVRSMAGVEHASLASMVPFGEFQEGGSARLPNGETEAGAAFTIISSDYFETLGLPILRGRAFSPADDERSSQMPPAVVNDRLARRLFGDADPLGQPVMLQRRAGEPAETFVVVGIVPGIAHDIFEPEPEPHLYAPYGSHFRASMTLHVRTAAGADEAGLLAAVQRELRQLDSRLPIVTARTMATQRDASLTQWAARAAAVMFSTLGTLALLLATIGVYGLKAYDVARRTREIGIRIALGATRADVTRLVLREGARTTAAGLTVGLVLAVGLGQLASGLLYRVRPFDPLTIAAASAILALAALAAGYFPARRAARVAPTEALRAE